MQHFSALRIGNHGNYKLQKDFKKFGEDCFEWKLIEVLETRDANILKTREQYWIDILHPEYNIRKDAQNLNWTYLSEESRKSISDSMKKRQTGRKQSQEEKDKRAESIRAYWRTHPAKKISQEMRQHLSEINTGKRNPNWGTKNSQETLRKKSDSRSNIIYTFKSPDGDTVSFRNLINNPLGLSYGGLRNLVRGITKEYRGWTFISKEIKLKIF